MRPTASVCTRLYRAALYLYPPAFRREFSREIVLVVNEARHDQHIDSPGAAMWTFWMRMSADLASTIVLQWLRTGWPIIVMMAMLYPLVVASAVASLWRRAPVVLPPPTSDADVIALTLLAAIVLVLIAATIILTLWFTRPLLYRRRT